MKYIFEMTWQDGSNLGHYSSKFKAIVYLNRLLTTKQRTMAKDIIVYRHGLDEFSFDKYKVTFVGNSFRIIPEK